jgi:hypothetical protein
VRERRDSNAWSASGVAFGMMRGSVFRKSVFVPYRLRISFIWKCVYLRSEMLGFL